MACPRTQVPDKPSAAVEEQRGQADKKILQRLEEVRYLGLRRVTAHTLTFTPRSYSQSVLYGHEPLFSTNSRRWKYAISSSVLLCAFGYAYKDY